MSEPVTVRLLEREFTVGCEPGQRDSLMAAVSLLDARMREIRGNNKMVALERVAVLAALNLASDYLQLKDGSGARSGSMQRTLGEMNRKLDDLFDTLPR
jgi:cell division protein ZapA